MEDLANNWNAEDLENWWVDMNFNFENYEFNWKNKEIDIDWLLNNPKKCPKCWFEFE
jgi:hypothetical protein